MIELSAVKTILSGQLGSRGKTEARSSNELKAVLIVLEKPCHFFMYIRLNVEILSSHVIVRETRDTYEKSSFPYISNAACNCRSSIGTIEQSSRSMGFIFITNLDADSHVEHCSDNK